MDNIQEDVARILLAWDPHKLTVAVIFTSTQIVVGVMVLIMLWLEEDNVLTTLKISQLIPGSTPYNRVHKSHILNERLEGFDRMATGEYNSILKTLN